MIILLLLALIVRSSRYQSLLGSVLLLDGVFQTLVLVLRLLDALLCSYDVLLGLPVFVLPRLNFLTIIISTLVTTYNVEEHYGKKCNNIDIL